MGVDNLLELKCNWTNVEGWEKKEKYSLLSVAATFSGLEEGSSHGGDDHDSLTSELADL